MKDSADWERAIDESVDALGDRLREVRRHLHRCPEPSGEEFETTRFLAEQLKAAGVAHHVVATERGIIAEGSRHDAEPRVVMRADMDALHIHDEKEVEYRSLRPGRMHACGHDAHSAIVLGAALTLHAVALRLPWACPWRAIFQPAEETAAGAYEMIDAGALDNAQAIIALHVDPENAVDNVGMRKGELTACCQSLNVAVRGHGGHAARPHHSTDPIVAAIQFVTSVYQTVPRAIDTQNPSVVTFGVLRGGENPNVIPEMVTLQGTIRTLSRENAERVGMLVERIARGMQEATGATFEVERHVGPDAVVNDPQVTAVVWEAANGVVGPANVHPIPHPSMGGEDFANYLAHVPGCMLRLGAAPPDQPKHFLHSPRFDIDERALVVGSKILARALVMLADPKRRIGP